MPKKKMPPAEYAQLRQPKITLQAVTSAIREGHRLPGVTKVEKYGRFYLLTVNVDKEGKLITEDPAAPEAPGLKSGHLKNEEE